MDVSFVIDKKGLNVVKQNRNYSKEKIPVSLKILRETDKALQCTEDGENEFWLPKSQIDYDEDTIEIGKVSELSVPRWLCEEKEIVTGD